MISRTILSPNERKSAILRGLTSIIDGIVLVGTLGHYTSETSFYFTFSDFNRQLERFGLRYALVGLFIPERINDD